MNTSAKQAKEDRKRTVVRKKRFDKVLVPEFSDAPRAKIKVILVDAKPGQPVGRNSELGEVKTQSRAKSVRFRYETVQAEMFGVIKKIYLKKGDTVTAGQPFALVELFDEEEFGCRSDEYEAALDSNQDIRLVEYPSNLKAESPEILRRAAKLMIGFYNEYYSNEVNSPIEECVESSLQSYLLNETNYEHDDWFPEENWEVSRQMFFEGVNTNGIDVWFEDDQLRYDFLEQRFANARYEGASSTEVFRYSNLLRWVYDNERAISDDSDLGDQRVKEIYEIIELEKGVETRTDELLDQ
ncbi:MAG: hypothetical protein H6985_18460 [Pseudomonadales bacterium]|nr:hypothetical protein [Pseudomonadales bacterium]